MAEQLGLYGEYLQLIGCNFDAVRGKGGGCCQSSSGKASS
jgi:hypothetical protein